MCSSFSANRRPMHMRRPYPNGKLTNGWIFCPACGHVSDGREKTIITLSIHNNKSSALPYSDSRFIHRSGMNFSGSGKYSSKLDTTKCGKIT